MRRWITIVLSFILISTSIIFFNDIVNPGDGAIHFVSSNQTYASISNEINANYFIQNHGQIDSEEIKFYSNGGNIFFTPDAVLYRFSRRELIEVDGMEQEPEDELLRQLPSEYQEWGVVLKYSFIGSNSVVPEGWDQCSFNTNYFKGSESEKWHTDIPNYNQIVYRDLWDGIDLVYHLKEESVKYDLIVHPGSDPSDIHFNVEGGNDLTTDSNGDLVIETDYWDIRDSGLISYYEDRSGESIPCRFIRISECEYGISLGDFDNGRKVVIDPFIDYSTFIGGLEDDYGMDIALDSSGNTYLTGYTYDGTTNYPNTTGAYNITHNGERDAFVTKLNSNGSSLVYSTFLGGSHHDLAYGIAVDRGGDAYITGYTLSGTDDFPTTTGVYDTTHNINRDVFVTKLNSAGSSLIYSTFIGGDSSECGYDIAIDSSENAYITGYTRHGIMVDYPTTSGAYDTTHNRYRDVFVTKLNSAGSSLIYSTVIGGSEDETGWGIEIDSSGNAYITGNSEIGTTNFPTTSGAYDTSYNGGFDVFVAKLNSAGSSLFYSTFIGGSENELGTDIAIDSYGNSYITGYTWDGTTDYPTTPGAFDTTHNGVTDVFVTKLSSAGSSLVYSTFLGGRDYDEGWGIEVDPNGNAYITGFCDDGSPIGAPFFPTTIGAYDTTHNGGPDVFVTRLNSTGSSLVYSTFIGGSYHIYGDHGHGIEIDSRGNAFIIGYTADTTTDYPTTVGAYDVTHNGGLDVLVSSVSTDVIPPYFGSDKTTSIATTGDPHTFSIEVADNVGVSSVFVEYWYGNAAHVNISMKGSGPFTYSMKVRSNSTEPLKYIFRASDSAGNWNQTSQQIITVADNDGPIFGTDGSDRTGTTGMTFDFNISVADNIEVTSVYLEYWFGSGSHSNESIPGDGLYNHSIMVPSKSTDPLHYIFHAVDPSGNWGETSQVDITIIDNYPPGFGFDDSDLSGTTGDNFSFSISAYDNVGVIGVHVEYWFGSGSHFNESMSGDGPYDHSIMVPSNSTDPLHYIFRAMDADSNWMNTSRIDINITDNDAPVFGIDESNTSGTTGENHSFIISATDNIDMKGVYLEYWFGNGSSANHSFFGDGHYELSITLPSNSTDPLHYIFHAFDSAGNWKETSRTDVIIIDNDAPMFGPDVSDSLGTTGDDFSFNISVTDNIQVEGLTVEFWFGNGSHTNHSIFGKGHYEHSMALPSNSTDPLHYIFHAIDLAGNLKNTSQIDVIITDNDAPVFGIDSTDPLGTTGENFTFNISVTDNIRLAGVYVEYWFGNGSHSNESMFGTGPYNYLIMSPVNSIDPLHYIFHVSDIAGNRREIPQTDVIIEDNDAPEFGINDSDSSGTTGKEFFFAISVSDNIHVTGVYVEYWFDTGPHSNVSMTGMGPNDYSISVQMNSSGTLHYIFHTTDSAGNWEKSPQTDVRIIEEKNDLKWILIIIPICLIILILIIGLVAISRRKRGEVEE